MRLSTHRLIIRRLIVLSSEIINTIVGPMRSGDWPQDATDFFNTIDRPSPTDYQYNLRTNHLIFRQLSRDYPSQAFRSASILSKRCLSAAARAATTGFASQLPGKSGQGAGGTPSSWRRASSSLSTARLSHASISFAVGGSDQRSAAC